MGGAIVKGVELASKAWPAIKAGGKLAAKYGKKAWDGAKRLWKKAKGWFSKDKKGSCQSCKKPKRGGGKRTKNRLPDKGPANGKLEKRDPQTGELQQVRHYDDRGRPLKDIDYGHDHGAGDPHVHDFGYKSPQAPNPSRGPGRAPTPGEIP